ncbi:MAG: polymer-forming cytoskeletal protein, partial [Burkholderiaceae bacterium]
GKAGKAGKAASTIDCLIGSGTVIEGDLRFRGGLRIDGEVIGRVIAEPGKPSLLVLSENAKVKGEIRAGHVVIDGTVEGPVQADELLELQARARVSGDIRYTVVEVQHGAIVEGAILHIEAQAAGKPGLKLAGRGAGEPAA